MSTFIVYEHEHECGDKNGRTDMDMGIHTDKNKDMDTGME
jgi:hypothetical protein